MQDQLPVVPENPRDFTPRQRAAFEERQRKTEALLLKMADSTPEESDRLAGLFFWELRAGRRISMARRAKTRPPGATVLAFPVRREGRPRERRAGSGSRTSSSDPGEDGEPAPPDWHWSQPYGWQGYIRSIAPGSFEQQRQRIGGAR